MTAPQAPFSVLLAEDDDNDAVLIHRALVKLNLVRSLKTVSDGEAAISYFQRFGTAAPRAPAPFPDLVVLDHHMPRISGVDVLFWLRGEPRCRLLPVVVFSVGLTPDEMEMLKRLNAAYCVKTVEFDQMIVGMREGVQRAVNLVQSGSWPALPPSAPVKAAKAQSS